MKNTSPGGTCDGGGSYGERQTCINMQCAGGKTQLAVRYHDNQAALGGKSTSHSVKPVPPSLIVTAKINLWQLYDYGRSYVLRMRRLNGPVHSTAFRVSQRFPCTNCSIQRLRAHPLDIFLDFLTLESTGNLPNPPQRQRDRRGRSHGTRQRFTLFVKFSCLPQFCGITAAGWLRG